MAYQKAKARRKIDGVYVYWCEDGVHQGVTKRFWNPVTKEFYNFNFDLADLPDDFELVEDDYCFIQIGDKVIKQDLEY